MKRIIETLCRLLYPNTCCFCGKIGKAPVCNECKEKVIYIQEPRCKKCGKPIRYDWQEYCHDCTKKPPAYEQGKSVWLHKAPVSTSIYHFKYHNRRIYAEFYAEEMYRLYGDWIQRNRIEAIVPVPLHASKKRKRGYNQAELIAKKLGEKCNIPVQKKAVRRIFATKPQKGLDVRQRRKNLQQAFAVTKAWKRVDHVLLIDDIYTTGSTICAITEKLKENGAKKVWFLTISIGQGF